MYLIVECLFKFGNIFDSKFCEKTERVALGLFSLSQTRAQLSVVGLSLTVKQLQLSVSKQSTSELNQNETKRTCSHSPNSKALLTASACQHIRTSKIKGKFLSVRTADAAADGRLSLTKKRTVQIYSKQRPTNLRIASGNCTSTGASPALPRESW